VPLHVGIAGSGIMAGGIADVIAHAGNDVVLRSRTLEGAQRTVAAVAATTARRVAKGALTEANRAALLARIRPTDRLEDLADCDVVIESIVEDAEAKRRLLAEIGRIAAPGALLATNTSTLPVAELAAATGRPAEFCGVHFFNPATALPLVEVVRPVGASDATIARATDFVRGLGKEPIQVADRAGFVVNALLFPYLNAAVAMHEAGVATVADIDAAMRGGANHPMGPFALLDLVGVDTAVAILDALHARLGDAGYEPRPTLRAMVRDGRLGRKAGRGFYDYGA